MTVVTANDLKTKGISDIERLLRDAQEVIISVRGKPSYVVMDIAHYDHLRECEIAAAWSQVREDVAGRTLSPRKRRCAPGTRQGRVGRCPIA